MRNASRAFIRSPVTNHRRAWPAPIFITTYGLITEGRIPSRASVKPSSVPWAAIATSAAATSPAPPPSAAPWTFATTALGEQWMAS